MLTHDLYPAERGSTNKHNPYVDMFDAFLKQLNPQINRNSLSHLSVSENLDEIPCRINQGAQSDASSQSNHSEEVPMETEQPYVNNTEDNKMEVDEHETGKEKSQVELAEAGPSSSVSHLSKNRCLPQRAALIKAVLSFLKKSIPDPSFSESIRNGKVSFQCFDHALHD